MSRSRNLEAFTGPELSDYMVRKHDARLLTQRGSHLTYRLPNGGEVGSLIAGYVPTPMARVVAKQLGMTYVELRAALRHPVVKRSKRRFTPQRHESTPVSKADVIAAVDELVTRLSEVGVVRFGQRDPAFYRDVLACLNAASAELARLPRPLATWRPPVEATR